MKESIDALVKGDLRTDSLPIETRRNASLYVSYALDHFYVGISDVREAMILKTPEFRYKKRRIDRETFMKALKTGKPYANIQVDKNGVKHVSLGDAINAIIGRSDPAMQHFRNYLHREYHFLFQSFMELHAFEDNQVGEGVAETRHKLHQCAVKLLFIKNYYNTMLLKKKPPARSRLVLGIEVYNNN